MDEGLDYHGYSSHDLWIAVYEQSETVKVNICAAVSECMCVCVCACVCACECVCVCVCVHVFLHVLRFTESNFLQTMRKTRIIVFTSTNELQRAKEVRIHNDVQMCTRSCIHSFMHMNYMYILA